MFENCKEDKKKRNKKKREKEYSESENTSSIGKFVEIEFFCLGNN